MKTKGILTLTVLMLVVFGLALMGGCKKEEPTTTKAPDTESAQYVNAKCPIMGSIIKPEKITADLVTEFKGEKVAFCCAMCPSKWDDLSDEEKAAKLLASK